MSKRVVIIGGSRGIGLATAEIMAGRGMDVHICTRNKPQTNNSNIHFHPFDLDGQNVREKATKIFSQLGGIDIVINNAGYLVNKPFTELSDEDIRKCYQVNVMGIMLATQAVIPHLNKEESHIVNISSVGGFQGSVKFAGLAAYSTSKAAICSFTELFAEEYKDSTIAMNCLCLGAVQTEMLEEAFPGYQAPTSPEEMGHYIADFASSAHRFFKGKILPVSTSTP